MPSDKLVARRLTELLTPESGERAARYLKRLLAGGSQASLEELELVVADGSTRTIVRYRRRHVGAGANHHRRRR